MKKTLLIIGIVLAAMVVVPAIYLIGTYNSFISQESGIVAIHEDMQNVHASIFNNIKSQGLSVEKYGDMVIKAIQAAIGGRYGEKGAQAAILGIKEENPTIDPKIMEKLQVAIESGYNRFEAAQRTKIDRIRVYDNSIGSFPGGWFARKMFGFPKRFTPDMRVTVTSAETKSMMETKELKTIDPFSK